uniref:Uncharacterized protein n=1 Tax=Cacopsylla melanoneura TaxID=428564 RepID=A0A8D8PU83_9HEMI
MNDPGGRRDADPDLYVAEWGWDTDDEDEPQFFWGKSFLPPPPRPHYLEDSDTENIVNDGLTTCDLCSWALGNPPPLIDVRGSGLLSWTLTLVIVSIISAVIGAVVMVTVLHCRRGGVSTSSSSGSHRSRSFFCLGRRRRSNRSKVIHHASPSRLNNEHKTLNNNHAHHAKATNHDAESTLSRTSSTNNLCFVFNPCAKNQPRHEFHMTSLKMASNHYTVDEGYQHPVYGEPDDPVYQIEEAVYTELDKVPHSPSGTPAYQNTGFLQCDMEHTSSAPSSAYYSDFSETTTRQYESIGDPTKSQLSVINETLHNVPSDYI